MGGGKSKIQVVPYSENKLPKGGGTIQIVPY